MNDFFNKEPPVPEPEPPMKRPDHWPTCKETIKCKEGTWLNELACMCMQEYQCNIVCPAKQVMDPWKGGCGCIDEEKLMDSFPDWVTKKDVDVSLMLNDLPGVFKPQHPGDWP